MSNYPNPNDPQNPFGQPPLPYQTPMYQLDDGSGKATAGLVLGLVSLVAWCIPLVGLPVTIAGLVFSIKGLKSRKRGMAIAGLILSSICLFATLVNAGIGAYMGAHGQMPWQKSGR